MKNLVLILENLSSNAYYKVYPMVGIGNISINLQQTTWLTWFWTGPFPMEAGFNEDGGVLVPF